MRDGPAVFAVEDTAIQVTWRRLAAGSVLRAADTSVTVEGDGGAGAAVLDGLPAGTPLELVVDDGRRRRRVEPFRTLAPPPGRELFRLATVNDVHIGDPGFGRLPRARDPGGELPPPERCLQAAVTELGRWGAELLVVKGDIADHGEAHELRRAAELLTAGGVPVEALPGNHDIQEGEGALRALGHPAITVTAGGARAVDRPGLRLVLADTTVPDHHHGAYDPIRDDVCRLVAASPAGPALVAVHHQPQWLRVPIYWPPGVPGPEARRFLDAVGRANPATVVTTGHTHRHRARRHGPVTISEVGSPHDYPGTWTGYVVHEGGLRQVVRRISEPTALRWTEATRHCYLGTWSRWSPGRRADRCWTLTWPERPGR